MRTLFIGRRCLIVMLLAILPTAARAIPVEIAVHPIVNDDAVTLEVSVDSIRQSVPIFSFEGGFGFDPTAITIDTIFYDDGVIDGRGPFAYNVDSISGHCYLAYAATRPIPTSGLLFVIRLSLTFPNQYDPLTAIDAPYLKFNEGDPVANIQFTFPTATDNDNPIVPQFFQLKQNYPNPFNPTTRITFNLERGSEVRLEIFNLLGIQVGLPVIGYLPAGEHAYVWDACDNQNRPLAGGIYFYRLTADGISQTMKMILIK